MGGAHAGTAVRSAWRLAWLFAAPHRLAFTAAALLFAGSALWWASVQLAQAHALPLRWSLPPAQAHGLLMTLGFMPLFFCGFVFTAGPKWLKLAPVSARSLAPAVLAQFSGWAVFMLAAHGRDADFGRVLGGLGVAAAACGWSLACWKLHQMLRASRVDARGHLRLIFWAGVFGAGCLGLAAAALGADRPALVRVATLAAAWGFVGVVFIAALHRMVAFFGTPVWPVLEARWPNGLLWTLVSLLLAEGGLAIGEVLVGTVPAVMRGVRAAVEVPAGIGLLALALRWRRVQRVQARLLVMLQVAWAWFGLAILMSGLSQLLRVASDGALSLGLAPLHAYTMGFLASTLLAMASRISAGQAGRAVAADTFIWRLFGVLQLAVLARITAAVIGGTGGAQAGALLLLAALAWAGVCVCWALRHIGWYGRPRLGRTHQRPGAMPQA